MNTLIGMKVLEKIDFNKIIAAIGGLLLVIVIVIVIKKYQKKYK